MAGDPIAIVGIGCRFPGARGAEAFWSLLERGLDAIREVPGERWDIDKVYDADPAKPGRMNTRSGGFIEDVACFDNTFFGISKREAVAMDPQHRILLEVCWEALEDAGIPADTLAGCPVGVFVGISSFDYLGVTRDSHERIEAHSTIGMAHSIAANRISYLLNLHGPSLAVDTACSSSLVAVHLACESLLSGDCTAALACGVNLILTPDLTVAFSKARMMAPDGRCKTFDDRADGYVRGEGAGVVVLKPVHRAIADGDRIYAVIRGSAINHDGLTNGLTAPNPASQRKTVELACQRAGIDPTDLHYVEAHGTGTALGDPIEVNALGELLSQGRGIKRSCAIGSVKTNIGHLEAAAGIAGLIKTALALANRAIPPSLNFEKPNRYIGFNQLPLHVQTQLEPWPASEETLYAGVSAFGFGGTNVHVVLSDAPARSLMPTMHRLAHVLVLSAKDAEALRRLAGCYAECLKQPPSTSLGEIARAANAGRVHFRHRAAIVANHAETARSALADFAEGRQAPEVIRGAAPRQVPGVAFLFPGQGCQYPDMARSLYQSHPRFQGVLDQCDAISRPYLRRPLLDVLFPIHEDDADLINETEFTQPALFAIGYALADLLRSWGVAPVAVFGHSVGECIAACAAGSFDLEDGLAFVARRAQLMQALPKTGAMAAVFTDERRVEASLAGSEDEVSIAAVNAPFNTVISGDRQALEAVVEKLRYQGVEAKPLTVSHAFHSPAMDSVLDEIEVAAARMKSRPLRHPLVRNLDSRLADAGEMLSPGYWRDQARHPVRFADGLRTLVGRGCTVFLELGPRAVLAPLGAASVELPPATWIPTLSQGSDDWTAILSTLAKLYAAGVSIDWRQVDGPVGACRPALPTYPFARTRHWPAVQMTNRVHEEAPKTMPLIRDGAPNPAAPPDRRNIIIAQLKQAFGEVFANSDGDLDLATPLIELGADSIVMMELVGHIEATFGVKIQHQALFGELRTIDALVNHLDAHLPSDWLRRDHPPRTPASRPASNEPLSGSTANREVGRAEADHSGSSVERLIAKQLEILNAVMAEQLSTLRALSTDRAPLPLSSTAGSGSAATTDLAAPIHADKRSAPHAPGNGARMERPVVAHDATPAKHDAYFKDLARRYGRRTQASKRYAERSREVLADARRSAGFRPSIKEMLYPVVSRSARDARLVDIDGNEYVDLTMGFGVHLFGHNPEFVGTAIKACLDKGAQLGPQAERAGKVANRLCAMTGMARAVFCTTGTEAVMTALRLARAMTGRNKVAMFMGSYHGHFDGTLGAPMSDGNGAAVPLAPGISRGAVGELLLLPYGDDRALETIGRVAQKLAAVLVEPVQSRNPALQPTSFLRALRQLTAERDIPLIFDEVITGFRAHPQGAQGWFGVTADMATYGKLLGGGLPIGVVAGRADLLAGIDGGAWSYGDDAGPVGPTTFFAGTYNKNPLTLAAADAVLDELAARGPTLQISLNQKTENFVASLNRIFEEEEAPIRANHFASFFRFSFDANLDAFFYELLSRGVYIWEGRTCFLSTAHHEPDLAHVLDAIRASIIALRQGGLLPSKTPAPRSFACAAHPDGSRLRRHDRCRGPTNPRSDILDVRLAKTEDEIARALELRYRVFYEEMGARAGNDAAIRRRDMDPFDAVCDHLIVTDQSTGDLLGTYRLIRRQAAERVGHFYSESEFEIGRLLTYHGEILELGRSCIAPRHRNGAAMTLLWNGIVDYVRRHDIRLLFGCASFPGRNPSAIAEPLALLHHRYRAPEELRPRAAEGRYVEMNRMELAQLDEERIMRGMPPLIRGYLAQGARVGDGAVIDDAFNTVDVALVLLTDWLPKTDV